MRNIFNFYLWAADILFTFLYHVSLTFKKIYFSIHFNWGLFLENHLLQFWEKWPTSFRKFFNIISHSLYIIEEVGLELLNYYLEEFRLLLSRCLVILYSWRWLVGLFFIFFIISASLNINTFWCIKWLILWLLLFLSVLVPVLISVAFYTLAERKIMAILQRRVGPNVVGFFGLLQALADGLKLVLKEIIVPTNSNNFLFLLAPILSMILAFSAWAFIPFSYSSVIVDSNYGVLMILMLSGLNIYSLILAGWASNNSFALLACLRAISQMISYEISLGLAILPVLMFSSSANFIEIVLDQTVVFNFLPLLPCAIIFFISILAETNRAPFDLPEAEAELVAGYNVEYASATFALFFLAEYSNMLVGSAFWIMLFWGGWLPFFSFLSFIPGGFWFGLKMSFLSFLFIFIRALLPRYRYDQLMDLGWKIFLPVSLLMVILVSVILVYTGGVGTSSLSILYFLYV